MAKDKDAKGKQDKSTGEGSGSLSKGKTFKMPSKLLATPSTSGRTVPKSKTFKKKTTVKKTKSLLKSSKSALKSTKSSLKSTKSALKSNKPALKPTKSSLKSTKSALKSSKSALKSTKSSLKSTKSALKSNKPALKSTKSSLKSTKSALKSTKSALKSTKSFLKSGTKSALKVKSFSKAKSSNSKSLQTTKSSLKAKSSTKGKTFSKTKSFLKTNLKEKSAINAKSLLKKKTNADKNSGNSKKSDVLSPSAKTVTNTAPKSPNFADDKSTLEITAHSDVDDKPKSMVETPVLVVCDKTDASNRNTTVKSNVDDAPDSAAEASIKSGKLETFKNANPPNGQRKLKMKQKRKKVLGKSMGKSEKCESNQKTAGKEAFTVITSSCEHEIPVSELFEVVIKSDVLDVSQQEKIQSKSDKPGTEMIPEDGKTKKLAEKGQLKSSVDKQALLEVASATALAGVVTATQIVPPQVQLQERTLSETGQPENDDWEYSWEEVELPQYEYVFEYDYVEGKDVHKYDHKEPLRVDEPLDGAPKVRATLAMEQNVAVMATDAPKTDSIQETVVHETVVPISLPQSGSLGNEKICIDSHQPKVSPEANKVGEQSSVQKEPITKNLGDKTASEAPTVVATKYVSATETIPTQPDAVLLGSDVPTFAFALHRVPSVTLKSSPSKEKVAQTKSPPKSPKAASEAPSQVPPVQLDIQSSSVNSTFEPSENTNVESSSKNTEEKQSFKVKSIGTTPCGSINETAHSRSPKETLPSIATEPKSPGSTKEISPFKPMVGSPSDKGSERIGETHLATSVSTPLSDNLNGVPKTESIQIGLISNLPDGKLPAEKTEMERSIAISDNSDKPTCAEKGVFMTTVPNPQSESATSKSPERKGGSDSTDSPKPLESSPQPISKFMDTSPKSVQVEENAKEFSSLGQSSTPADTSNAPLPASEIPLPQNAAVTETILPETSEKKSASPPPSSKQEDPMHKSESGD